MNFLSRFCLKKSFTYLELLMVLAIIGLLVAIAYPVAYQARIEAAEAATVSNLKQIRDALYFYHIDNGSYPLDANDLTLALVPDYLKEIPASSVMTAEGIQTTNEVTDGFCSCGEDGGWCYIQTGGYIQPDSNQYDTNDMRYCDY